ncbi:DUF1992 domain-containing protein [Kutzneria sp. NPDC052558]|uniref:DUF1992 domain-containing protein n=1 Tax=Kutzneria sp. NPDC052558 TaxID=3364121 RepID=UPI0037CBC438
MTERRPAGMGYESWLDKQIREGEQRGEFDDLPGRGKPLPDRGELRDADWWARSYLAREGGAMDALLPESLQLRKEVERLSDTVRDLPSERLVREHVSALNQRIAAWLRSPSGPHVRVGPVDADEVVEQWRAARHKPVPVQEPAAKAEKRRWWRRRPA